LKSGQNKGEGMGTRFFTDKIIQKTKDFHGHMCPGLAIGIRAAELALREIGPRDEDEEILAVVETDMCAVDAIQFLTGCTFGKGNLIHRDFGKRAFSFYRRVDGKALRIVALPRALWLADDDEAAERDGLRQKMGGGLSPEERKRFAELQNRLVEKILQAPLGSLFEIKTPLREIPARAQIHRSRTCEACGEEAMETRLRQVGGKLLCIPCSEHSSSLGTSRRKRESI
jgi:formylmethanofuran dehydrogenase subunit E